jgi:hypothetical protein
MKRACAVLLACCLLATARPVYPAVSGSPENLPAGAAGGSASTNQAVPLPAAALNPRPVSRKDPLLAGVLSWSCWGLGHFYAQEYTRGSLFALADLAYKGLLVGLVIKISEKYGKGDQRVSWSRLEGGDRALVIGYLASWIGLSLWSALDAAGYAEAYNARRTGGPRFGWLDAGGYDAGLVLGWEWRF